MNMFPDYKKVPGMVDFLTVTFTVKRGASLAITNIDTKDEKAYYGIYPADKIAEGIVQTPPICEEISLENKLENRLVYEQQEHRITQVKLQKKASDLRQLEINHKAMMAKWLILQDSWKKEKAELEKKIEELELLDYRSKEGLAKNNSDAILRRGVEPKLLFETTPSLNMKFESITQVGTEVGDLSFGNIYSKSIFPGTPKEANPKRDTPEVLENDTGTHYRFQYCVPVTQADADRGTIKINLDPFRIADIYGVESFAAQTILKKVLCAGNRGHNSEREDVEDIMCAARRWLQMLDEDDALSAVVCPSEKK